MSAAEPRRDSSNTLVWVHDDGLDPSGPALAAYPDAPAFFVFDEAFLEESGASFKQVVFLYECLLEIPQVRILKGDLVQSIAYAARETGSSRVATTDSASPRVASLCKELRAEGFEVEVLQRPLFVDLGAGEDEKLDLKRFSRYWKVVKHRAMQKG